MVGNGMARDRDRWYALPTGFRKERFTRPSLDRPVRDRQSDPVQSSSGDLRDILLCLHGDVSYFGQGQGREAWNTYNEGLVMIFKLA